MAGTPGRYLYEQLMFFDWVKISSQKFQLVLNLMVSSLTLLIRNNVCSYSGEIIGNTYLIKLIHVCILSKLNSHNGKPGRVGTKPCLPYGTKVLSNYALDFNFF